MRRGTVPANRGDWVAALPAWGDRYVRVLLDYTLPALAEALRALELPCRVVVWTDQTERVEDRLKSLGVVTYNLRPPPGPDGTFMSMSECHRHAMRLARPGDRVLLLTADMVVSREILATCERHIAGGRRLVCCVAMRALEDGAPPVGASGRDLLAWAWDNRHPMTRDCTWPDGRSFDVWRMYFERDGEVAARVFLPHPLVVVPYGRPLHFNPTIDVNLACNFAPSATAFLTAPEEGAVVELSPTDKDYVRGETMRDRLLTAGPSCPQLVKCTNPRHRMFFSKRAVIRGGGGDCGDGEVARVVLG